jgi:BA14K-like protein
MRMILRFAVAALAVGILVPHAQANSQSYCEMFAKDFADVRTTDVDLWQKSYRNAFNDCMNQYTAAAPVAAPKKALQKQAAVPANPVEPATEAVAETETQAAAVVKAKPEMEPGSPEWNEYCAAKYRSFNPDTGTYNSHTGKERRCVVTQ